MNQWIRLTECPLCDSVSSVSLPYSIASHPAFEHEWGGTLAPSGVIVEYHQCQMCGFVYQNPRMADDDIEKFYSSGLYRTKHKASQEDMDKREREDAVRIVELMERLGIKPERMLDVGCSRGYLLDESSRKFGCNTFGVELNLDYVQSRPNVLNSDISLVKHGPFDTVTMIHTLEHVPYPVKFLELVSKQVSPKGGVLIVEVPATHSQGGPLRAEHLSYFHPWTMVLALNMVHMKVRTINFTPHLLVTAERSQ